MGKLKIDFKYKPKYFDEQGNKLVGVTTAINKLAKPALTRWAYNLGRDGINFDEYMNYTQRIGTITHARIMAFENDLEIDKSNITPNEWKISNYGFSSYKTWYQHTKIKPYFYEKSFVSLKDRFGGTPDKYGDWDGVSTIIDYKSGKDIYKDNFVQLIGYAILLIQNKVEPPPERVLAVNVPRFKGDSFAVRDKSVKELLENGYREMLFAGLQAYFAELKMNNSEKDTNFQKNKSNGDKDDFYQYCKGESK